MSGMIELPYGDISLEIGSRSLIGQDSVRSQLSGILSSGRLSHAYLFAGPAGIGKKALSLAFAEAVNGIDHFTDLQGRAFSKKSSWYNHPDIRIFIPLPGAEPDIAELTARTELLNQDPYNVVDFSNRPTLTDAESSSSKNAFYSVKYYRNHIRPTAFLKPNEGFQNIIIISEIERMRPEVSNAFLKLLEEPPPNMMFILTTDHYNSLLPTITSRCQVFKCIPLSVDEIRNGLIERDGYDPENAEFLSRISGGNYASTRFYEVDRLRETRNEVVQFLRFSYIMDATEITKLSQKWHKELNIEGQVGLLNLLEVFVRDLAVFRDTGEADLLTNFDQLKVIQKFCESLGNARLHEMQRQFDEFRMMIRQNVSARFAFTVLANRFTMLMRGRDPVLPDHKPWKHLPAFSETD